MRDRRRREETAVPAETIEEANLKTQEPLQASAFLGLLQTVDKTLLVSTPEAFFLFWVQKVCT